MDTSPRQALQFRILDMADESAVLGTKLLADLGADVIRIEPPCGDATRQRGPFFGDIPHPERSLYFMYTNTNKRGITLDLDTDGGKEVLRKLSATADAVVETFPVGHMASLGLGYDDLHKVNPDLVVTSVTPFGQTGPYRHWKGSNIVHWALGSPLYLSGKPDRPPLNAPDQAYVYSGLNTAIATLAALWGRRIIGGGQHVDISVHESIVFATPETGVSKYLDDLITSRRSGSFRPGMTPQGLFPCKDGYVCVVGANQGQWDRLAQWIYDVTGDETALAEIFRGPTAVRYVYEEIVLALVESLTVNFTKEELFAEGKRRDVPVTPMNTIADLLQSEQLQARDFWTMLNHPSTGPIAYPGAPFIMSESPATLRRPAPKLGQHNEEIYLGELGLSPGELGALLAGGAL